MGTSKSYGGLKGHPNWGPLSSAITQAVNDGHPTPKAMSVVMSRLVTHMGGSQTAASGGSRIGGRAGIRTAQRFGSFLVSVQANGFPAALNLLAGGLNVEDAHQAIYVILEKCSDEAGLLDENAAKAALRDLLKEIGSDAESIKELGDNFNEAIKDYGTEELIVMYFGFYLFEHLCTDFYEKLIKEKGIRETEAFYRDLKDYIQEHIKTISKHRDLRQVNWNSDYGKGLVQEILRDTLKEFENYEG